ncbi:hypothetical protein AALP_AA5G078900 [Arabis alpina]|uniref:Serpin domain-containing protein n=1 Tax=Arabis alpina TaxID=50452 RepID=A0A087GVM4_ARAAL|nr:hypothetical protein AALP_AA5G078900 [Arabis alpina]
MKNQNDIAMFLAEKVISSEAKETNFVFSPASINVVLTMVAATTENKTLRSDIISLLKSSSTDELNAVFREMASLVLADGSKSGGPKISAVNGVWMEQTLSVKPSLKDLFENFFKATFAQVDFRSKLNKCARSSSKQYIADYDGFKVLKLPFKQNGDINRQFSMYFYLPDAKNGLDNLGERMASIPGFVDSHIPRREDKVGEFRIPKFKIELGFEATNAFKLEVPLFHKACVEIDEDGA